MRRAPRPVPSVEAWLAFIESREGWLHGVEALEVAEADQVEFQTVYGICAQAIRFAGAYVVLHRAGRAREGVAVGRQALEHALTAQWAHFSEDGPQQLIDGYHHSRERMFRAVTTYLNTPKDEVDEALSAIAGKGRRLLQVTKMIEQIDFDSMFRTTYMQESQIVHVTSETVAAFLQVDDRQQFSIVSVANDPHERQTAHFTAIAAMFASWLLQTLCGDAHGLEELDRLSTELALPLNVRD